MVKRKENIETKVTTQLKSSPWMIADVLGLLIITRPCCMSRTIDSFCMGKKVLSKAEHFHCSYHAAYVRCKTSIVHHFSAQTPLFARRVLQNYP